MSNDISKKRGKSSGEKRAKKKVKRKETYAMYIYKVLKQVSNNFDLGLVTGLAIWVHTTFVVVIIVNFPRVDKIIS